MGRWWTERAPCAWSGSSAPDATARSGPAPAGRRRQSRRHALRASGRPGGGAGSRRLRSAAAPPVLKSCRPESAPRYTAASAQGSRGQRASGQGGPLGGPEGQSQVQCPAKKSERLSLTARERESERKRESEGRRERASQREEGTGGEKRGEGGRERERERPMAVGRQHG
eukprot:2870812-Rhodomonas_salina.2